MKKLLTALTLVVALLFAVPGCFNSAEVHRVDLYASIFDVPLSNFKPDSRVLVKSILDFNSYVFRDLSELGMTCPSWNTDANDLLNKIEDETILEKYIADIAGYRIVTYLAPNVDEINTEEFKNLFEGCSGGIVPLQARKGRLVFGDMGCSSENELLLKKCESVMSRVEKYFNI